MEKAIRITYDGYHCESSYLVESEDYQYAYMTNKFTGQHMRYNKLQNCLENQLTDGTWQETSDCIIQVDFVSD